MKKKIISVQSQVATGYVGNSMAIPAIQLHGLDPVSVPTVLLSNHIEYEVVRGGSTPAEVFMEMLHGIDENKIPSEADYFISGYINDPDLIRQLGAYIADLKQRYSFQYVCDPVSGDYRSGGLYIKEASAKAAREFLVPVADILTPNSYELDYILNTKVRLIGDFSRAISEDPLLKDKIMVATGMELEDTPTGYLEILLYDDGVVERFKTPKVDTEVIGTGDLFTAVLVSQMNLGKSIPAAIEKTADFMHQTLLYIQAKGYKEYNAEVLIENLHGLKD